jgi:hypothetical protein
MFLFLDRQKGIMNIKPNMGENRKKKFSLDLAFWVLVKRYFKKEFCFAQMSEKGNIV